MCTCAHNICTVDGIVKYSENIPEGQKRKNGGGAGRGKVGGAEGGMKKKK